MPLVLDVDNTPAVLAAAYWLAVDDDRALRADDREGNHALHRWSLCACGPHGDITYPDALVELDLLVVVLLGVEGVEADVVVDQLLPNLRASGDSSDSRISHARQPTDAPFA